MFYSRPSRLKDYGNVLQASGTIDGKREPGI
jgi:hypothetical protein